MDALTPFDTVVAMLTGVREAAANQSKGIVRQNTADCPACGKAQKLNVAELRDGSVLLNCYPCGGSLPPLDALGLSYSDLYPAHSSSGTSNGGPAAWLSCASLASEVGDKALEVAILFVAQNNEGATQHAISLVILAEAMKKAAKQAMRNQYNSSRGGK